MAKKEFLCVLMLITTLCAQAQFPYGTTGLLHMPTADMQKDKTFMFGGSFLNKNVTPNYWSYNTYNYYINITLLPFLEVGYTCTLNKALSGSTYYPKFVWGKYCNQDRQFSIRLRILKEEQFWKYMPAIVLGGNDVTTNDYGSENHISTVESEGNGHWNRYYIAMTKHTIYNNIGTLGIHIAYLYNKREDYHINGPAIGGNFRFSLQEGNLKKVINGLNLIAEYDSKTFNTGFKYSLWKDHINFITELNNFNYLSGGIYFKVYLK